MVGQDPDDEPYDSDSIARDYCTYQNHLATIAMDLERFLWHRLPCNVTFPPGTDFDPLFRPGGVTIYRTAYDALDSDGNWQALLDKIQKHLREELLARGDPDKEGQDNETVHAAQKLLSLFRLDARSDAQALAGASMDQLREIYNAGAAGGEPMNARVELSQCRVFLVADDEVLASVARQAQQGGGGEEVEEEVFVKCAAVDYRPEDHDPPPGKRSRVPTSMPVVVVVVLVFVVEEKRAEESRDNLCSAKWFH
ncbi:hypothetical protein DL765_008065 [Monosporascus sp. GIB2]|nr:hypothetical protein DL765_008065 [Monosporascus sp. GIB2]